MQTDAIVRLIRSGYTQPEIARVLGVKRQAIYRKLQYWGRLGELPKAGEPRLRRCPVCGRKSLYRGRGKPTCPYCLSWRCQVCGKMVSRGATLCRDCWRRAEGRQSRRAG